MKLKGPQFIFCVFYYACVMAGKTINNIVREHDMDNLTSNNNLTDSNKDMYVVNALVYQVGVITNRTDELNHTGLAGNQEAVTFYHTNGSEIDLSSIPAPLLTNVTAQSVVGLAPVDTSYASPLPFAQLAHFTPQHSGNAGKPRQLRDTTSNYIYEHSDMELTDEPQYIDDEPDQLYRRSLESKDGDVNNEDKTPVNVVSGAAVIPPDVGVQSLLIPPLLTLNSNFSEIPVPIPNTAIVHYSKINTLIHNVI